MAGLAFTVLHALWLFLPAYLANMSPVFVGGGKPIDGGRDWKDGRRILGDGKTWRGLLLGPVVSGTLVVVLDYLWSAVAWFPESGFPDFGPGPLIVFVIAYAWGFGALLGDTVESFFKRRLGKKRGDPWIPFDQLDFVVGAFVVGGLFTLALDVTGVTDGWLAERWTLPRLAVVLLLTPALHLLVNYIGFKIGKKEVPW